MRPYLFRGLITCGLCGRSMVGNPNHGRLYYRCKASRDFVRQHEVAHPPVLYLREDAIVEPIDRFLHQELTGGTLTANLRSLADAHYRAQLAAHKAQDESDQLRRTITECDTKIERYRAAPEAGSDPALIAGWISETSAVQAAATAALRASATPPQRLNEDQISAIVEGLGSLLGVLREADPRDKAELYSRIGLRMTFKPGAKTLKAEIMSSDLGRVLNVCPRGDTNHYPILAVRGHGRPAGVATNSRDDGPRGWPRSAAGRDAEAAAEQPPAVRASRWMPGGVPMATTTPECARPCPRDPATMAPTALDHDGGNRPSSMPRC
ncbi:zinc ribbon domain-containing protein [Couchioplanes caeruleus]|uniref:zinc ribbon domain-containing protein n=1 Tax=Couchioplanes caeruleus TaxID=56438 RepID=UPI0008FF360C|nr:zinc ribbon domain-containing protein [Couchioplanes caeruleus]